MRIISGNFRGKKILLPKDKKTRPLRDSLKESIFNIIEHSPLVNFKFENSKVLDLFSGVGSFGLECISRGTEHVTFVEKYSEAMIILKKNINSLNCLNKISIYETDILQPNGFNKFKVKEFDLIFLDPPFKETNIDYIIKNIYKFEILKKNGLILIHRNKISKDKFPEKFKILIEKKYGISKIIFGKLN